MSDTIGALVRNALESMSPDELQRVFKSLWLTIMRRERAVFRNILAFENTLEILRRDHDGEITTIEVGCLEGLHYVVWCEGPLHMSLSILCYLTTLTGRPFDVVRAGRGVVVGSPSEILSTSIGEKLRYLSGTGVRMPAGVFDPKLRNAVAHMDFRVDDDGVMHYDGSHISHLRLQRKVWAVRDTTRAVMRALARSIEPFVAPAYFAGPVPPEINALAQEVLRFPRLFSEE